MDRICDDIDMFGHTEIVLKSDGKPAMVQVQAAVKGKRNQSALRQNPLAHNAQANGAADRAVQEVMSQIRVCKIGLQGRINKDIAT